MSGSESTAPSGSVDYWIAWSHNYRPRDDGYITHAWDHNGRRTLCGVTVQDSGGESIVAGEAEPGCIRCRRKLRSLAVLPPQS